MYLLFRWHQLCRSCRLFRALKLTTSRPFSSFFVPGIEPSAADNAYSLNCLRFANSKITSLMRNGRLGEAERLFDKMPQRNIVTHNAMIRGYFLNGSSVQAVNLFHEMTDRDVVSYNTLIAGLMQIGDVGAARKVFAEMMMGKDVVTWNSMISGLFWNGLVDEAVRVFSVMPVKDVVSWNLMISGLLNDGQFGRSEVYFREMGAKDISSWTIMISGYLNAGRVDEACQLFEHMPEKDNQVWSNMISGCIRKGCVELAENLFRRMPQRDISTWHHIITQLMSCRHSRDSIRLFMEFPNKCSRTWNSILLGAIRLGITREMHALVEKTPFSNSVSFTNVIIGYFELGDIGSAIKAFYTMPDKDCAAWNATICRLGEKDEAEEGIKLYSRMREGGATPDDFTHTTVLMICSELPALYFGRQAHAQVMRTGFYDYVSVSNSMVTMYARCGDMDSALQIFSSMEARNVISWNSIICGYARHGNGFQALEMFQKMRMTDVCPDHVTFIGLLSACDHSGLVENGKHYFNFMRHKCFLQPTVEHYTCIVNLLGKSGSLDAAVSIIDQMEADGLDVPSSIWGAILGASRIHKRTDLAEIAAKRILHIEPSNSGTYTVLTEMYSNDGRWVDAQRTLGWMKDRGVKKQPGCSWIEGNNRGHIFISGDDSHPDMSMIYWVLGLMHLEIADKKSNSWSISPFSNRIDDGLSIFSVPDILIM